MSIGEPIRNIISDRLRLFRDFPEQSGDGILKSYKVYCGSKFLRSTPHPLGLTSTSGEGENRVRSERLGDR